MSYQTVNTPSKLQSSFNKSISPKRKSAASSKGVQKLSLSTYRAQLIQPEQSVQSSLIQKIIENQITSQQSYQNLLIHNKQLQLKLLNLQQESKSLRKQLNRVNKPLQEIKNKILTSRHSLIQKQKYLEKFYDHLDSKLKSNLHSNLFNKLQKIQKTLQEKYEQQKEQLFKDLATQHEKVQKQNQEFLKIKNYRDDLIKVYTSKIIKNTSKTQKSQPQSNHQSQHHVIFNLPSQENSQISMSNKIKKKQNKQQEDINSHVESKKSSKNDQKQKQVKLILSQHQKRKLKNSQDKKNTHEQSSKLKQSIKRLKKQKDQVQKQKYLLKILLNIDQQHKKYSAYIVNGYKKLFSIKYRDLLVKRKQIKSNRESGIPLRGSSSDFGYEKQPNQMPDIEGIQKKLIQKKAERKILEKQLESRNIGLQKCKQKLNQQIGEYGLLQQRLMSHNNNKNIQSQSSDNGNNGYRH